MNAAEWHAMNRRLRELEEKKLLPEETLRDLKRWWREKLSGTGGKVVKLPWVEKQQLIEN